MWQRWLAVAAVALRHRMDCRTGFRTEHLATRGEGSVLRTVWIAVGRVQRQHARLDGTRGARARTRRARAGTGYGVYGLQNTTPLDRAEAE